MPDDTIDLLEIPPFLRRWPPATPLRAPREKRLTFVLPKYRCGSRPKRKGADQCAALRRLGYTENQIRRITRAEAGEIVAKCRRPTAWQD